MLIEDLIAADSSLRVDTVELEPERLIVNLAATTESGICPGCGVASRRGHSHYHRNPVDLPIIGYGIRLRIRVRRFFCDCPHCPKRTFAEQFPELLPYRARHTTRMTALVESIWAILGGAGGFRCNGACRGRSVLSPLFAGERFRSRGETRLPPGG